MFLLTPWIALVLFVSLTVAVPAGKEHTHRLAYKVRRVTQHSLLLYVRAQDDMNDPDDLTVAITLINKGSGAVKILNDPNSVLSTWKTHTFDFVSVPSTRLDEVKTKADVQAGVMAVKVKYSPTIAAARKGEEAFTVLQPGENKTVIHDCGPMTISIHLSGMYSFRATGTYKVKLASTAENFNIVEDDGSISTVGATVYNGEGADQWSAITVPSNATLTSGKGLVNTGIASIDSLTKNFSANSIKRASSSKFNGCTMEQQNQIIAAAEVSKRYLAGANQYLAGSLRDRYVTWFGVQTENRVHTVKDHFGNLAAKLSEFQYDCSCTQDLFAYVFPDQYPMINLCISFWRADVEGTDSQAGAIIHEATHFTVLAGTDDHAYTQVKAKALAQSRPDQAIMNAEQVIFQPLSR
ncbi:Peptidyl-Lys metalloendopeptidase [Ceratobasidium theobromae]|uniref:Peptidyl-Lys metalloendopeptidase n=1 Tax=Ceratobasidium theobromae TaxID=1582974 RepID=A0A5N5QTG3_9AGAM|nr:Peptidyl-Lys metalloendopeptidase [Ceratobasidium theobromae]